MMPLHPRVLCVAFCTGSSSRGRAWLCARDARRTLRSSCYATRSQSCTDEQPTSARRRGPSPARCGRGGPAPTAASRLARHTRDPVALAPTPHCPTLDPTHPTSRPPAHHRRDPPARAPDGPREPDMGLPPHHRRTRWSRPADWSIDSVENPQTAPHRPRPAAHERDLDPVPALPCRKMATIMVTCHGH